ncbi:hypothetical protein ANTQUA_LOCUS2170 [Anthophora quadrimaculata]
MRFRLQSLIFFLFTVTRVNADFFGEKKGFPFKTNGIKARPKIPLTPKTPPSKQQSTSVHTSILLSVLWSAYNEALLHSPARKCAVKSQRAGGCWKPETKGKTTL